MVKVGIAEKALESAPGNNARHWVGSSQKATFAIAAQLTVR
jgi:hypothetical protein